MKVFWHILKNVVIGGVTITPQQRHLAALKPQLRPRVQDVVRPFRVASRGPLWLGGGFLLQAAGGSDVPVARRQRPIRQLPAAEVFAQRRRAGCIERKRRLVNRCLAVARRAPLAADVV